MRVIFILFRRIKPIEHFIIFTVTNIRESSSNLTHCSRLLTQFEKPQVDNNLNQSNANNSTAMETEESNIDKAFDGDSGIENMETDDASAPIELSRAELEAIEEQAKSKEIETFHPTTEM